ncbi:metallophosphoesterase family protein [Pararhodospirillum photometricum]|uniref:metallophosphoesterase family protein n=1 Tax=Pararhodospirillum photometricum TaxID=1084 RepID=UPI0002F14247|nr:DNA repair exonuclease [Pararhodospirillum photometricum]
MFRFLHTADIHLDSPLRGLSGLDGTLAERVRGATRETFRAVVDLALAEKVAFVLVAGDLYDGDWRDMNTGLFFVEQMGRLAAAGIPALVVHGNHDAEGRLTHKLPLPPGLHIFPSRRPTSVTLPPPGPGEPPVVVHGQSYRERAVTTNLALDYPAPVPGAFNIGLLHTGLGGRGGHENYAPCTLADLLGRGYNYWALGHVHQAEVVHPDPPVVFPGIPHGAAHSGNRPQGRDAGHGGRRTRPPQAGGARDGALGPGGSGCRWPDLPGRSR